MDATHSVQGLRKSKRWNRLLIFILTVGGISASGWACYRYKFPYGWSHCCSAGIGIELTRYAIDHDGWLPHGKPTPERSLSIILDEQPAMIEWIRGKNIPR